MSIQANELRIGNYIQDYIELEKRLVVYKIEDGVITCGDKDFDYPYLAESVKGIPLTPSILEACGFKSYHSGDFFIQSDLLINIDGSTFWWTDAWNFSASGEFDTLSKLREVKYLHELQDIHYIITKSELTYNQKQ